MTLTPPGGESRSAALIGVLPGEGCGPELVRHALDVLAAAAPEIEVEVEIGGPIGSRARRETGSPLPPEVVEFCRGIFARGGAVLAGAGGDRFVYDARREFELAVKVNPVHSFPELGECGRWRPPPEPIDLLVVRENLGGLYQGQVDEPRSGPDTTTFSFPTGHEDVARATSLAARLASRRRGRMTLVSKEAGLPGLHRLWADAAHEAAAAHGVAIDMLDIDVAAYMLLREPEELDVVVTSNCFGDVLSDLGGHIMGSRGNTYGASYSPAGAAIYQTNHGCAEDLAGSDRVNPAGQILSLAMLVREQFGWNEVADSIAAALRDAWRSGIVTADLDGPDRTVVGTSELVSAIVAKLGERVAWHAA